MNPLVYVLAALVVAILLWFVTRSNAENGAPLPARAGGSQQPQPRQLGPRRRRNVISRMQRRAEETRGGSDRDQASEEDDAAPDKQGKVGAKKMKKLQEKEERKKMREMEAREREERKKEQAEKDEKRKLEEEKKLKDEERIAEEKRKELEEKERQAHEEYMKLKAMFTVEEEGDQGIGTDDDGQNMLLQFVEYIKLKKVVLLEDLASHFGLRTQETIDRIQTMLSDEILSGVIDDRGKFIYISNEELSAVAKFVNQRGRVSISDLAQASNSLINLASESVTVK